LDDVRPSERMQELVGILDGSHRGGPSRVKRVSLSGGRLEGVVGEIDQIVSLLRGDPHLEGAEVQWRVASPTYRCVACGVRFEEDERPPVCPECGGDLIREGSERGLSLKVEFEPVGRGRGRRGAGRRRRAGQRVSMRR